jgi:hypothetical protein
MEALSVSLTFAPSAKFAPPPVMVNVPVPGVLNELSRSNSTSMLLER